MRRYAGASMVVLGIILSACGLDSSESIDSRLTRLCTEWTVDASMYLLMAGSLLLILSCFWLPTAPVAPREEQDAHSP